LGNRDCRARSADDRVPAPRTGPHLGPLNAIDSGRHQGMNAPAETTMTDLECPHDHGEKPSPGFSVVVEHVRGLAAYSFLNFDGGR
jgi:hypothetical protein